MRENLRGTRTINDETFLAENGARGDPPIRDHEHPLRRVETAVVPTHLLTRLGNIPSVRIRNCPLTVVLGRREDRRW